MAKHLIGFGLFGSIIGVFVFASWLFSSNPVARVKVVEPVFSVTPWSYCDKRKRSRSVNTPRAVADRNSGTITLYLNELPGGSSSDSGEINATFTFYAVRGDEVRIKYVVRDSLVRTVRHYAGTKWILQYNAPWVRELTRGDNLYVQAGVTNGPTAFSIDSAMPVLIKN